MFGSRFLGVWRLEEAGLGVGCPKNGFAFGGWGLGVGSVPGIGLVLGLVLVPVHVPVLGIALGPELRGWGMGVGFAVLGTGVLCAGILVKALSDSLGGRARRSRA